MSETISAPAELPVTVVVTRRIRVGHESQYEAWLGRLLQQVAALPGYLGTTVHRPPPSGPREYTSVFRFDSIQHLREFEESALRRTALAEVVQHVEADASWQQLTGMEFWFAPPAGSVVPQPSRWRMALVMIVVVYGLVLSIGQVVGYVFAAFPSPVRLLVTITIEVMLMTWFIMPRLTRALSRWIYPVPSSTRV